MKTMKKLWMAASVAAISMTGCQEEQFEGRLDPDNYYASVETFGTDTRTALAEGRSVVWSSEDRIAIFEGNGSGQAYQVLDAYAGKSSGEFAEVEGLVADCTGAGIEGTIAVYPFNKDLSVTSGNNGNYIIEGVTFPSVQKHIAGSFSDEAFPMAAICEQGSKNLSFKNIGGVLKLSLTGSYSVSQITLTGNSGEILSGPATVTLGSDGIPSVTMSDDASTSVSLICDPAVQLDPDTATDFYISIPPTEFEAGFSVNITDSEGRNAIKNTEKQNNVCRSQILVMPAFAPPTHLFKENYYEDYDAYISEEGITMLSKKTEDGYEILIGHYDETEDSWNDNQFMIIHTDSLSRISDLYIENELLRFSNYSDNAVDILHIVGEDYELYEHIETPTTRSVLFATKSEGADADQGSETIDDLIKVIAGTKASFELAVNLVKHKGKIQTVLASINYISTAIPGLGGVALSEIQIGLEKKFLGRMPSFIEGELLLVEAVNVCVEKLSDILIGPWKITNTNVIVHTAESAIVNYTVSGIKSDPSINLSGSIGYRNVTKNDHFTNISIPVTNGTHQKSLILSGPGDYILIIALNGTGGFLKRMQMHFTVPDYPMCQTGSAYNITTTSAVVDCTFSNIPEDGQCEVLLSWDDGHKIVNAENREGTQSITLSSLKPNTTYSYCASIDYEGGPVNGEMKEFTTKGDNERWVDLGLSVLWAAYNVGASSPEEYGGYYAWGETSTKSDYTWENYKHRDRNDYYHEHYGDGCWCWDYKFIGNEISGTSYDVAHVQWGGGARMPTLAEVQELVDNCTFTYGSYNGVGGSYVTGPNGNSIFLPFAGRRLYGDLDFEGSLGYFWSGTYNDDYNGYYAYYLYCNGFGDWYSDYRYCGQSVRPVTEK